MGGGAGLGAAGYGIGKATGTIIDKAVAFEGIPLKNPDLQKVGGPCPLAEASYCIITEQGRKCFLYCFRTEQEARKSFQERSVSRILFSADAGKITGELERG